MDDLISRQAAIDRIVKIRPSDPKNSDYTHGVDVGLAMAIVAIEEQPSAQRKGKWIEEWEMGWNECPFCHESYLWEDFKGPSNWNYCPSCGAEMAKGESDGLEK